MHALSLTVQVTYAHRWRARTEERKKEHRTSALRRENLPPARNSALGERRPQRDPQLLPTANQVIRRGSRAQLAHSSEQGHHRYRPALPN